MMNISRMAAMIVAMLLVAYPLSIGPVMRYHWGRSPKDFKPYSPAVTEFYSPIKTLAK